MSGSYGIPEGETWDFMDESTEQKPYPAWVCLACGDRYGNRPHGVCTIHTDTCGICGKRGMVTEPRDFGHMKDGWDK